MVKSLGLCDPHYRQVRQGKQFAPIQSPKRYAPKCTFEGCDAPHFSKGLCSGHYQQNRRGEPLAPILRGISPEERFWAKVDRDSDAPCWRWTGALTGHGYGNFRTDGRNWPAHRLAYVLLRGEVDRALVIDHLCRHTWCVNPDHLEPVSPLVNIERGIGPALARIQNVDQTYCKHGHPLFGDNLYVQPKTGYRYCRECQRRRNREYAGRRKEARLST